MNCICGDERDVHWFDAEVHAYQDCKMCACEGFEPSENIIEELNFEK